MSTVRCKESGRVTIFDRFGNSDSHLCRSVLALHAGNILLYRPSSPEFFRPGCVSWFVKNWIGIRESFLVYAMNGTGTGASPKVRDIARYLIAYEAVGVNRSQTAGPAALEVCEKLRRPLSTLTGAAGFRSLLVRALTLAKREAHVLNVVHVNDEGFLEGLAPGATAPGGPLLVAQLLGLLMTFIGEALTMRLLCEIWPDLLGVDLCSEERESND